MSKLILLGYNPVVAKLYHADDSAKERVSTLLAYFVDGHEFMDGFKSGGWDGRSTFFNWSTATFPRGFADDVEAALQADGYDVKRVAKPLPEPLGPMPTPEAPLVDAFPAEERYDYQFETALQLERRGVMIARIATGGGKSRIAKLATKRIGRPTLFVTTRTALMHQMRKSYEASGWTVGMMGDGEWEPDPMLNVAMIQTLTARLMPPEEGDTSADAMRQWRIRERTIEFLQKVEFLIGEEAHEAGGGSYYEVLQYMRNASYRMALTATPFMRDASEANMRLKAAFGPIGIEASEKLLIDRGILATPYFKFIDNPPPALLRASTKYHDAVKVGIVNDNMRNRLAAREVARAALYGLTSMILVARKDHGETIKVILEGVGLRAEYIHGEKSQAVREAALGRLERGEIDVLIGTNILDVGVDVPAVGMVVLLGGGKAEIQLRQRIGRGLREKRNGLPNCCFIVDFKDRTNSHLRSHALSRQEIIRQTPGFVENILPDGHDFDFEALGFKRRALARVA